MWSRPKRLPLKTVNNCSSGIKMSVCVLCLLPTHAIGSRPIDRIQSARNVCTRPNGSHFNVTASHLLSCLQIANRCHNSNKKSAFTPFTLLTLRHISAGRIDMHNKWQFRNTLKRAERKEPLSVEWKWIGRVDWHEKLELS